MRIYLKPSIEEEPDINNINSSVWRLYVNDQLFPDSINSLMSLSDAHKVLCKLSEIEDLLEY